MTSESMIAIFPLQDGPIWYDARRQKKYFLLWCAEGTLSIVVDGHRLQLHAHQVTTITSGQVFHFEKTANVQGYLMAFTYDFFCKDDRDIELIFHNGLFCHFGQNEVLDVPKQYDLYTHFRGLKTELDGRAYQHLTALHAKVALILVEINRARIDQGLEIWRPDALFLTFLEHIIAHAEKSHSLSHFAHMLGTTNARLNELSKRHTGKTAQNVIYSLIVSEAQRQLMYSERPIKQIAHRLGFRDPFYFSKFFKRHVSESPRAYRRRVTQP